MEGTDRQLFERSLRHALESHTGSALDDALGALGWHEALGDDPRTAVSVLFELHGATTAVSSSLTTVMAHGLGLTSLPTAGLVLPWPGSGRPPGWLQDGNLTVDGLASAPASDTHVIIVAARSGGGEVVLDVSPADLALRSVGGVAPDLGLVGMAGTDVPFTVRHDLMAGHWVHAVALARLAVGHELIGTSKRMLALAREHALQRIQFDRPISSFQAVRHRLADTLVAIEAGDAALGSAWDEGSPPAAAMAKALAGRAARTASRHCQQVLAGIGFTTEHDLHRSVRRVLVLDELFGSARSLTRDLGRELLATRELPPLPPL